MTAEATSAEHPLVGQTIQNKYKIVRLLGEGGMGCVYLGEQQLGTTARKVAVKTLHKHLSHDASILKRFEREVGTVAALEHPNTIQVFDFGKMDDGTLFIVMEFVQGRSVADILEKDGPMDPARVENILRQVVGSLEEAHNHGIVHRDLKPDNVVLCERAGQKDWVEVLDFGIAKRSSEHDPNEAKLTQQGMVLGTPPYMSPEQFTGMPVDVRSDIYALGVMAYEMLTGRLPWEANTAWEWASKHMTEPPIPIESQRLGPNVPPKMKNAIGRSLAKNKDERFATVREFFESFSTGAAAPLSSPQGVNAPQVAGTAVMGAHGGPPPAAQAVDSGGGGGGRVKTEMGAPMAAPDFGGGGPAAAPPPPMQMGGPGPAPAIPAGPQHSPPQKSGPNMLVIGLAGLGGLLIVGAIIAFVVKGSGKTPVATVPPDFGTASASAGASAVASHEAPPPEVTSAAPLDSSAAVIPPTPNNNTSTSSGGGGGAKPIPTPTSTTKPVPTPTPTAKTDPPVCQTVRKMKASGKSSPATISALEQQCRNQGGTP